MVKMERELSMHITSLFVASLFLPTLFATVPLAAEDRYDGFYVSMLRSENARVVAFGLDGLRFRKGLTDIQIEEVCRCLMDHRSTYREPYGSETWRQEVSLQAACTLSRLGHRASPFVLGYVTTECDPRTVFRAFQAYVSCAQRAERERAVPRLLRHPSGQVRLNILAAIRQVDFAPDELITYSRPLLFDPCNEVRSLAIGVVGGLESDGAPCVRDLMVLLDDMQLSESLRVGYGGGGSTHLLPIRAKAAGALGSIGPAAQAALPKLSSVLEYDHDPLVQVSALLAVGRISQYYEEAIYRIQTLETHKVNDAEFEHSRKCALIMLALEKPDSNEDSYSGLVMPGSIHLPWRSRVQQLLRPTD